MFLPRATNWIAPFGIMALVHSGATGQGLNLLPSPPPGTVTVRLVTLTSDLSLSVNDRPQFAPIDMSPFPDGSGRLAVLTLGGLVRVIDSDGTLLPEPYLDVVTPDTNLLSPGNFGIISIAFHPDFADPEAPGHGRFYIVETEFVGAGIPDFDGSLEQNALGGRHHDVLYEYTAADPGADVFSGTRREVLRVEQPGWDHNMFDLAFGLSPEDEGLLYISLGDGANVGEAVSLLRTNATILGNVFGKILRIDPLGTDSANGQYGIPPTNPFVDVPGAKHEIYSYGHRSPYRLNADRLTGELWLGEVGQTQVEEINRIVAGGHYGWPFKEGSFLFFQTDHDGTLPDTDTDGNGTGDLADDLGLIDPVFEVDHQTSRSITGGFVYRGEAIPDLEGLYVFGNNTPTTPGGLGLYYGNPADGPVAGGTGGVREFILSPDSDPVPARIFSIGEDQDGELYLLGQGTLGGVLQRVEAFADPECTADTNDDGQVSPADFGAWVTAFNAMSPACDQNGDGLCTPADFGAWISNFNAGC